MEPLQVKVHMYPVGELGDCFLLNFSSAGKESHILIDCGSFRNNGTTIPHMQSIAADIKTKLSGKPLDVVVGTHQHNDHLSGYVHAFDTFKAIGAGHVWLSWLDSPDDTQAQAIAGGQRKLSTKLQEISKSLSAINGLNASKAAEHINDVLGFYGLDAPALNSTPVVPQQGLNNLKALGGKQVSYLYPGTIMDLPGLDAGAVKVYVLGPPKDNNLLFDINPGKGESYDSKLAPVLNMADGFMAGLTNFVGKPVAGEPFFPFDQKFEKPRDHLTNPLMINYSDPANKWRNIDEDWLDQAENMALYLDAYTNNSSLVLAFELVESQKVLLFVGDAQTGNWLSWKTIDWAGQTVSLDKLLQQTVLYKVGHHCSHNATLPESLEKMTHPELVAMIPVDISDPNITKVNGWKMPAANLYKRIKELTKNRILRADMVYETDCDPAGAIGQANWGALLAKVDITASKTVVTYTIEG